MAPQAWKYNMETIPALGVVAVRITKAADRKEHQLKMLNPDGTLLRYGPRALDTGLRGYETSKDSVVAIDMSLMEKAAKVRDQILHTVNWVPVSALEDMIFDEKAYYVAPEKNKAAQDVFSLFHQTLKKSKHIIVGTFVLKKKEYCYFLRPMPNGLLFMQTFHYPADVRGTTEFEYVPTKFSAAQVDTLIEILKVSGVMGDYNPAKFVNEVYEREQAVIDAAVQKKTPVLAEVPGDIKAAVAADIQMKLQESLAALQSGGKATA